MKKLWLIPVLFLALSCKKKACYTCTTQPFPITQAITNVTTEKKCGLSKTDAKNYAAQHTNATTITECVKED